MLDTLTEGAGDAAPVVASVVERATRVATDIAAPNAGDVDRAARFPAETISGLRAAGLLSAAIPVELGGEGVSLTDIAMATRVLGGACASSAMTFAMHQIQVFCLVRHGTTPDLQAHLASVASGGLLLASATTEAGIGGDVRSSLCAVEIDGATARLAKDSPVISYGEYADAVLATARRTPDSPPSDQVLVYCPRPSVQLEPTGEWDTLGFRGTCSRGFQLQWEGSTAEILPVPYTTISAETMLPVSHIVWASVWLGIAEAAARSAHAYVRAQARRQPGTLPVAATRLADVSSVLHQFRSIVDAACAGYTAIADDPEALGSMRFAVTLNGLKVSASTLVVDIVSRCMGICGMAGYRIDSEYSLGRLLRDAHGAALMVNNDRINGNTAQMLMASKEL